MKAWILTGFYLWKDIWSRWLETPGAFLARLGVGVLLAAIMLLGQAVLILAEHSLEARIARLGSNTLLITESATAPTGLQSHLAPLLQPATVRADFISLRRASIEARDEFGRDVTVLVYGTPSLPALAPFLAIAPDQPVHLIDPQLPAGLVVQVTINGRDYSGLNLAPPDWLSRMVSGQSIALIPETIGLDWLAQGWFETVLLVDQQGDLRTLAAAVRAILKLENRTYAHLQSPEQLLRELAKLRRTQDRVQTGAGLIGGIVVALVFGSIAILEYRQNRYVAALLRSFGAPAPLLVARYAIEAILITTIAVIVAQIMMLALHQTVFELIGFEPVLIDRQNLDPYTITLVWKQARWLLLGAGLSLIPVAFGLRQSVGRILQ